MQSEKKISCLYRRYDADVEPLDDILHELGVDRVDLLKVDIEGYVQEALPGMINTLKNTRYLFIELLGSDVIAYRFF